MNEFRTGQKVPESGIFRVKHQEHRLPHEVTLLKGAEFPRCSKCKEAVVFEIVTLAPRLNDLREKTIVYELPDMSNEKSAA